MNWELLLKVLGWWSLMNLVLFFLWFVFFTLTHDWIYRTHGKWFNMSVEQFDAIHYTGMTFFKIFILAFNIVPYLALRIVV